MDPRAEPVPREVARKLRPVFLRAGERVPLTWPECDALARLFVYPNLVHWVLHMCTRGTGRCCDDECPVYGLKPACREAEVEGPQHVIARDGRDFCGRRTAKHPWALQVSFLWNGCRGDRPSRDCARDLYAGILSHPDVKRRWPRVERRGRPKSVMEQWDALADALDRIFTRRWDADPDRLGEVVTESLPPNLLTGLIARVNTVVSAWAARQRDLPDDRRRRFEGALVPLCRTLICCVRHGWHFDPQEHAEEVHAFLALLDDLDAPDRDEIRAMLEEPRLSPRVQRILLSAIQTRILPLRDRGLPEGEDPLNDPLLQDLFWDWVGSGPRPDGRPPFDLDAACWERWRPVEPGSDVPRWRAVP